MHFSGSLVLIAAFTCTLSCWAADGKAPTPEKSGADPDLPQTFDPNGAHSLLENSPFTRTLNLSDSLVLTGIAYIQGKPIVTIMNKVTKESYVVSDEPNSVGWKLAQTNASSSLTRAQAKVMIGGEMVTIRYSDETLSPDAMKKGGFKPGGGDAEERTRGEGPPGGGDRGRRGGFGRPSQEDMDRFRALSDTAKGKFIGAMMESRERMANATDEERNAFRQTIFKKIEQEDGKGPSK